MLQVGDKLGNGTVVGIVRVESNGSQLLEINTGRVGLFGYEEIDTVWSDEL
jgi:hypothetical protein